MMYFLRRISSVILSLTTAISVLSFEANAADTVYESNTQSTGMAVHDTNETVTEFSAPDTENSDGFVTDAGTNSDENKDLPASDDGKEVIEAKAPDTENSLSVYSSPKSGSAVSESRDNIAMGKTVDFVQTEGNTENFQTANKKNMDKVTDGDESTGGSVLGVWAYDTIVDLGEEYLIDTVNVNMKTLHVIQQGIGYTRYQLAVCVSSDGVNYRQVTLLENPDKGDVVSDGSYERQVYEYSASFSGTLARFIKIADKVPVHNGNGYTMQEIEVYGTKSQEEAQDTPSTKSKERAAYYDGKIFIDVSEAENTSLPLVIRITDSSGNVLYTDLVDVTDKRLVIADVDEENVNVALGGAINAPDCRVGTVQELLRVSVGEYISLGGHLWQCVLIDENGPLMLCEETIGNRIFGQTALWRDSDLKKWFDESFDNIDYAASSVKQKQTVTDKTYNMLTDGKNRIDFNHYPERMDNDNLYSYYVKDKIFVPDIVQLEKIKKSGKELDCGEAYWTRTPMEQAEYDGFLYSITKNGNIGIADSKETLAVRPAFYLNYDKISVYGGFGLEERPYSVSINNKPYISVSEKGFTERLSAHAEGGSGKLMMVFYDKDMNCVDVKIGVSNILTSDIPEGVLTKVFYWNSIDGLKPLTQHIEVINRGEWLK